MLVFAWSLLRARVRVHAFIVLALIVLHLKQRKFDETSKSRGNTGAIGFVTRTPRSMSGLRKALWAGWVLSVCGRSSLFGRIHGSAVPLGNGTAVRTAA